MSVGGQADRRGKWRRRAVRRANLALAIAIALGLTLARPAVAQQPDARRHAISKIGEPWHGPDFQHFRWVNPKAPKGGFVRIAGIGKFDSFNGFTYRGSVAPSIALLHDSLFASSSDEPATAYGLIAEWVSFPADYSSATFGLRAGARFHDGRPITPADVVFSLDELKKASPAIAIYYRDVVRAEVTGEREVTFRFARAGSRDLPYAVSLLSVVPRHYWTAIGANGEPRDLSKTTLEPPVGSGPYRIRSFEAGRRVDYERVRDYWAKDLAVNRGQYNFDEIRVVMFRDDVPEFEAFKAGEIDIHPETSSRKWATLYTFPAVRDGRVIKLAHESSAVAQMQGFVLNMRRPKFMDPRVRRAFALAYDFESANSSLFYGLYKRINGFFDNSDMAPRGRPEGRELALLERHRANVPAEAFGEPYRSPVHGGAARTRENLREALRLLAAAGWRISGGVLRHGVTGEAMEVEYLGYDRGFDRIVLPYQANLEKVGIKLSIRVVDASQYEERLKRYDFEMITDVLAQSHAPGSEVREMFGSAAADRPASRNRAGIKSPVVDALVEDVIYARDRADQVAAARALDRVLMWNHVIIPQWYNSQNWIGHWSHVRRPDPMPSLEPAWLVTWWSDAAAAKAPTGR